MIGRRAAAGAGVAVLVASSLACRSDVGSERTSEVDSAAADLLATPTEIARDTLATPDSIPAAEQGPDRWTAAPVSLPSTVQVGVPVISGLRTGVHPDYERVVVELSGEGSGFPRVTAEYVDQPLIECGSGREIHPVGEGWLEVHIEPADGHNAEGKPTIPHTPQDVPRLGNLERIYLTCDFEAVSIVVLAVASPNPFRVFTLEGPRRIVVDVQK